MLGAVGEGVQAFWQDGMFLDYTIEVEDKEFKVHKLIMASVSDYFKAMLTGGMAESQTNRVRLEGQNALAVSKIIDLIYTGRFDTIQVSKEDLLACAMYLQIPQAIKVCCQLLCDNVNAENCLDILATFKTYNLEDGITHTVSYIRTSMDEVLSVCNLEEMSQDQLQTLLDCWGKSEWKLFVTIKEWIEVDVQNRNQHLNDIMNCVRFALMTPEQLEAVKDMAIYSESDGTWQYLVAEAEEYHKLPIHLKVLNESKQSRVRADPTPLCFKAEEKSRGVFHAVKGTAWIRHKALNHPKVGFTVDASVVVNNFFIACDEQKFYVFDPRTGQWSFLTKMAVIKRRFCLVHCAKQLYIVGGEFMGTPQVFTDSIERYDLETDNWSVIPTKIPVVMKDFSACSLDGSIYVAGGCNPGDFGRDCVYSTRMDCFDPISNTWSSKAPVPESFQTNGLQVMELCRKGVLFTTDRNFYMQYYRPSTDQWSAYDPLCRSYTETVHNWWWKGVLPSRNALFCIDSNERDNDYTTEGACQMWTISRNEMKAVLKKIDDFPLSECNKYGELFRYFLALLALAPQSVDDN